MNSPKKSLRFFEGLGIGLALAFAFWLLAVRVIRFALESMG